MLLGRSRDRCYQLPLVAAANSCVLGSPMLQPAFPRLPHSCNYHYFFFRYDSALHYVLTLETALLCCLAQTMSLLLRCTLFLFANGKILGPHSIGCRAITYLLVVINYSFSFMIRACWVLGRVSRNIPNCTTNSLWFVYRAISIVSFYVIGSRIVAGIQLEASFLVKLKLWWVGVL